MSYQNYLPTVGIYNNSLKTPPNTLYKHPQPPSLAHIPVPDVESPVRVPHLAVAVALAPPPVAEVHIAVAVVPPADALGLPADPLAHVLEVKRAVLEAVAECPEAMSGVDRSLVFR